MKPSSFEQQAGIIMLEGLRKKLKALKAEYAKVNKKFNTLCNQLDDQLECGNPHFINEVCSHLTVHLAELDIIDKKVKEISEIMDNLIIEISN